MKDREQTELVFGIHSVASILKHNPSTIRKIIISSSKQNIRLDELLSLAKNHQILIEKKDPNEFNNLLPDVVHQGIIAECLQVKKYSESDLENILQTVKEPPFLLILDGISDPHNLGACLRTADAAGVHAIITPKDRTVPLTPTVRKVASGAAETIPYIQVTNLARTLRFLKKLGIWVYGLDEHGQRNIYQADLKGPLALVLGAEGKGLRRLTKENCDELFSIPMAGSIESLNVSVAVGVCLYEAARQRKI